MIDLDCFAEAIEKKMNMLSDPERKYVQEFLDVLLDLGFFEAEILIREINFVVNYTNPKPDSTKDDNAEEGDT